VREVSLVGTADLAYWRERLAREELAPAEKDGHAQILIVAADSRFMGVRFRELSVSVLVSGTTGGSPHDGAYLIRAFNSSRFFAFCERTFFATPYEYGDVSVSVAPPAGVRVAQQGKLVFEAQMATGRAPSHRGPGGWNGPVYLPAGRRASGRGTKLFFARIGGETETYPFLPGSDSLTIGPSAGEEVFQSLVDSHFVPRGWSIRPNAMHAKSKTYRRSDALLEGMCE
jgi:hypothetical protein